MPFDVLYIINELNTPTVIGSDGLLPTARPANAAYYYDTNGDRYGTPMDALWVINYLNYGLRTEGEYNAHHWYVTATAGTWGTNYVNRSASHEPDDGQHAAIDDYFAENSGIGIETNNLTPAREPLDRDGLGIDLENVLRRHRFPSRVMAFHVELATREARTNRILRCAEGMRKQLQLEGALSRLRR